MMVADAGPPVGFALGTITAASARFIGVLGSAAEVEKRRARNAARVLFLLAHVGLDVVRLSR